MISSNNLLTLCYTGKHGGLLCNAGSGVMCASYNYSSDDYGATFGPILDRLDGSDSSPSLWRDIFFSPLDQKLVITTALIIWVTVFSSTCCLPGNPSTRK